MADVPSGKSWARKLDGDVLVRLSGPGWKAWHLAAISRSGKFSGAEDIGMSRDC